MGNKKKAITKMMIGVVSLLVLVFGASYAYFAGRTSNNFGTSAFNLEMGSKANVALTSTNNDLALNLSELNMTRRDSDITYYGTVDGTPSLDFNEVVIGTATTLGDAYYNCDVSFTATATGTNNMYTAFQGMSGKSAGQIILTVGGTDYDFNTANLFPINGTGKAKFITKNEAGSLKASLKLINKTDVLQDALAGTDINISINVTGLSCYVINSFDYLLAQDTGTITYWCDNNYVDIYNAVKYSDYHDLTNDYFMKEIYENGITTLKSCANFQKNGTDDVICLDKNAYQNIDDYINLFEYKGITCTYYDSNNQVTNNLQQTESIRCQDENNLTCNISSSGVSCGNPSIYWCNVSTSGYGYCGH